MLKVLKNIDIFGQFITLKYEKNVRHQTILGGFCSLLLFLLAASYFSMCLYTMMTFQKIQITSSISNLSDLNMQKTFKDIGIDFVFSVQLANRSNQSKTSYNEFRKYIRIYVSQNGKEDLDFAECNIEKLLVNKQNPDFQLYIQKTIQSKGQVHLCINHEDYEKISIDGMNQYFTLNLAKQENASYDEYYYYLARIEFLIYNFEIKKDLLSQQPKNLIFVKEITKYNELSIAHVEIKQEIDFNTYQIQDSFIYLKNSTTEQGQFFTVQKPYVLSMKQFDYSGIFLKISVYYSGLQNNQFRTCYNFQNALNDTFSVVGFAITILRLVLFEFQQGLLNFKILQNTFYKKEGNNNQRVRQRLSFCNKMFLMKHHILSKFEQFNKCFSFLKLQEEDQKLLYFYENANDRYNQFADLVNIIKDIQRIKNFINILSRDPNLQIGILKAQPNIDWEKIDIDTLTVEIENAQAQGDSRNDPEQHHQGNAQPKDEFKKAPIQIDKKNIPKLNDIQNSSKQNEDENDSLKEQLNIQKKRVDSIDSNFRDDTLNEPEIELQSINIWQDDNQIQRSNFKILNTGQKLRGNFVNSDR